MTEQNSEDRFIRVLTDSYVTIPEVLPDDDSKVELDLGCGKGLFTTRLAQLYPDRTVVAADVMIGRLRKLYRRNVREGVENLTPLRVEARHLLGYMLPDNSVDRLHILCPDPWPKDKHRALRLLCADFITHVHRVIKPDGCFHFSSDDIPYLEIVKRIVAVSGLFEQDDSLIADISDIKTDFEIRWLDQGKPVHHIAWRKLPLSFCGEGH